MSLKTAAPAAPVQRLRKPSWKDPRLLLGLLLVLGSVAGVTALMSSQDQTTQVWTAGRDLPVGTQLQTADFQVVSVRLGDAAGAYLRADEPLPENTVAGGLIRKGELIARADLSTADRLDRKPFGLDVETPLPSGIKPGDRIDVWASMPDGRNGYGEPRRLLEAAEISEISVSESVIAGSDSTRLLVLVEDPDLPGLLGALSNQAKIAVVPNPSAG
ncbi:SAF domain-containing protein [Arthrobacter sp. Sa2CUA1]|uniref:SAF domain-containing protein n=1 Tax=Arthrobacter gallicola TaxID=2762225 RepID=A0ABR8US41_9MICC|nr:SAF domain-containing protein [Arthrobacter gallicola]MBD7995380.1 SAF domain-containing protein [Arthrobacter gallicola]